MDPTQKITESHVRRTAYLYIRQSTLRQVFENTESTARQYALRQRAVALGWPIERIEVIDSDLGHSGAQAEDRQGFQKLVAEVGMGNAGLVMGLEVSRLARNSTDWHRLLEICALSDTLILDEDGLYDPNQFNDRLLLGLKGTMSEAELHLLRSRLQGGILNKARRGELQSPLPVGLIYNERGDVALDPDRQVQEAIRFFFETFRRTGTAWGTIKSLREQGVRFPRRLRRGPHKGELHWDELRHSRALQMLHNPRYAGAFFYGRTRTRKNAQGKARVKKLPSEQWPVLIRQAHVGYITWEQYEDNLRQLAQAAQAHGADRRRSPPREGPALLQGLVLCGRCGQRMTVRYYTRFGRLVPEYLCQRTGIERGEPVCQRILGGALDEAIGNLLVQAVTPLSLEVALSVQQELQSRLEEADRLRRQQVERARYEAELSRRRFMQVDPDNRLVADALEAEWNEKLKLLTQAQEEYQRQSQADRAVLSDEQRKQILALAADFPRLWRDPKTPQRERKRVVRLLIEDVTLLKNQQIIAHIRFKGGKTQTLSLPPPQPMWKTWETAPEVIGQIDRLLEDHTDEQIARILSERGLHPGKGGTFNSRIIARLRKVHGLASRYERLRRRGLLTKQEIARKLGVAIKTVQIWRDHGLLTGQATDGKHTYLYDWPQPHPPTKMLGRKLSNRHPAARVLPHGTKEVQYET
jgi:DNA invertase Pin-like site-specific DNA recombinase